MPVPDAAIAVQALFNPRNITILGASESYDKWGNIIPGNILAGGYEGKLYLVNPKGGEVHGVPVYRSVEEIPDRLDLVMMAIPAEAAEAMLPACGRAGARAAIVISGGFSESSSEGRGLEMKMVERAHACGIRIVGPNTMGIYTAPYHLTALMPAVRPLPGSIAFAAQSGNLGTQMLGFGAYRGVGFSRFVCIGNESDLDFVDYLEYFAQDEVSRAILLYVEGFKDPRRFFNAARRISREKPIVIYKAGGTRAGSAAAASHSAAMAGSQEIYQGMINQLGLSSAATTEEMLDISDALVKMPLPRGNRVAILTWGGGWGVITADLCEREGLSVDPLPQRIKEKFASLLPSYWSKGNPVDLVGVFDIEAHVQCLKELAASDAYDSVISLGTINANVSFQDMMGSEWSNLDDETKEMGRKHMQAMAERFMGTLIELIAEHGKPILTVGMPQREDEMSKLPEGHRQICIYSTPERAVRVMSSLVRRSAYLQGLERAGGLG
jgi:acyl-CoA synthetase (NDP forming)